MASDISKVSFFFFFIICCICWHEALSDDNEIIKKDISWWCSTTPHPDPCNYYNMGRPDPITHVEFRTMTIRAAMNRAIHVQTRSKNLGSQGKSKRKKIVHRDCYNLIDNTIHQLNTTLRSIQLITNATLADFDAQTTWLSAALTNVEICRTGSHDLNVAAGFRSSILSGNVSELISNSLAANGALFARYYNPDSGRRFSGRVAPGDRKLLQVPASMLKANVTVSADGSGRFRSIQEAINYATSRRVDGNARVVVYVKKGVYVENILINRTMNKVMLVGDGVKYTVITGSRSVSGGYTTYSSATVGKSDQHLFFLGFLSDH